MKTYILGLMTLLLTLPSLAIAESGHFVWNRIPGQHPPALIFVREKASLPMKNSAAESNSSEKKPHPSRIPYIPGMKHFY